MIKRYAFWLLWICCWLMCFVPARSGVVDFPKRGTYKSPVGAGINWAHPLGAGLLAFVMNEGGGTSIYSLGVGRVAGAFGSGTSWSFGDVQFSGSSSGIDCTATSLLNPSTMSVVARLLPSGSPSNLWSIVTARWGNNNSYHFAIGDGSVNNHMSLYINGGQVGVYTAGVQLGRVHLVGFTVGRSGSIVYLDGIAVISQATPTSVIASSTTNTFIGDKDANSFPYTGTMEYILFFDRELSASALQQLYADPYCFLISQSPARRYWLSVGGTTVTRPALLPILGVGEQ